jgi:hypothetical protein
MRESVFLRKMTEKVMAVEEILIMQEMLDLLVIPEW